VTTERGGEMGRDEDAKEEEKCCRDMAKGSLRASTAFCAMFSASEDYIQLS